MTICITLQWDLTCITPVDFVSPVIDFLEFVPSLKKIIRQSALNIYIKAFHGKSSCVSMGISILTGVGLIFVKVAHLSRSLGAHKSLRIHEPSSGRMLPTTILFR